MNWALAAESVPAVTAEALARALATMPRPPWYEAEPFKTLLAVVIGGFLTLAANWWLKHLELRARADSLKVAFRGEVSALRGALRVEAKHAKCSNRVSCGSPPSPRARRRPGAAAAPSGLLGRASYTKVRIHSMLRRTASLRWTGSVSR